MRWDGRSPSTRYPRASSSPGRGTLLLADAVYLFPGVQRPRGRRRRDRPGSRRRAARDRPRRTHARSGSPTTRESSSSPAAKPDLVILKTYSKQKVGDALERVGIPVLYLDLETPEIVLTPTCDPRRSCSASRERAATIVRWYESRVAAVSAAVRSVASPTVGARGAGDRAGHGSRRDRAARELDPGPAWSRRRAARRCGSPQNRTTGWLKVGIEQVAAWDPDHVLVVAYASSAAEAAKRLAAVAAWQATRAGRAGAIRAFPADLVSWDQSDTRWILGLDVARRDPPPGAVPRVRSCAPR